QRLPDVPRPAAREPTRTLVDGTGDLRIQADSGDVEKVPTATGTEVDGSLPVAPDEANGLHGIPGQSKRSCRVVAAPRRHDREGRWAGRPHQAVHYLVG